MVRSTGESQPRQARRRAVRGQAAVRRRGRRVLQRQRPAPPRRSLGRWPLGAGRLVIKLCDYANVCMGQSIDSRTRRKPMLAGTVRFKPKVLAVLAAIPEGRVTTYGTI